MRTSEPGRLALGVTRGLGTGAAGATAGASAETPGAAGSSSSAQGAVEGLTGGLAQMHLGATGSGGGQQSGQVQQAVLEFEDPDAELHAALARIRSCPVQAAAAAMSLLPALPALTSLELHDSTHLLLRALARTGGLAGLRELRLVRLLDVLGEDVEEVVRALAGLRRLVVVGCWPLDGEALLRVDSARERGVDVVWRP